MSVASDPSLRAASREFGRHMDSASRASVVLPEAVGSPEKTAERRRGRSRLLFGALAVVSALLALRLLGSVLAQPLEVAGASAAPAWQVQVSTTSNSPGIVLAYGPDVGVQLLRIPARQAPGVDAPSADARVIPARLARGELHLVTLSFNSLHIEAPGAPGTGVVRVTADAPIITVFQSPKASGVRMGW